MPPAEAQGVDSANSLFYKKVKSNISHGFTYSILLSTIRQADGFETTDCLECLQILDILIYGRRVCFKAGDWTLCTILGYGLPERETFRMLSLISFRILALCKKFAAFGYSEVLWRFQVIPNPKIAPGLYKVVHPGMFCLGEPVTRNV